MMGIVYTAFLSLQSWGRVPVQNVEAILQNVEAILQIVEAILQNVAAILCAKS